jgi:hypothetical protein
MYTLSSGSISRSSWHLVSFAKEPGAFAVFSDLSMETLSDTVIFICKIVQNFDVCDG